MNLGECLSTLDDIVTAKTSLIKNGDAAELGIEEGTKVRVEALKFARRFMNSRKEEISCSNCRNAYDCDLKKNVCMRFDFV